MRNKKTLGVVILIVVLAAVAVAGWAPADGKGNSSLFGV